MSNKPSCNLCLYWFYLSWDGGNHWVSVSHSDPVIRVYLVITSGAVVTDIRTGMMTDDTDDLMAMYRQLLPILGINFDSEVFWWTSADHNFETSVSRSRTSAWGSGRSSGIWRGLKKLGENKTQLTIWKWIAYMVIKAFLKLIVWWSFSEVNIRREFVLIYLFLHIHFTWQRTKSS